MSACSAGGNPVVPIHIERAKTQTKEGGGGGEEGERRIPLLLT